MRIFQKMKKLSGIIAVSVAVVILAGCYSSTGERISQPDPKQTVFKSPAEAAAAMLDALRKNDDDALLGILGEKGRDLVFSGDPAEEKKVRDNISSDAEKKMTLSRVDGRNFMIIGEKEWKFPVPIVSNGTVCFFETVFGRDEILNQRIRMNEIDTIKACKEFVKMQQEFSYMQRVDDTTTYEARSASEKGKKDGLTQSVDGKQDPIGRMLAASAANQTDESTPVPYNGYLFKVLRSQGEAAPAGKMDDSTGGSMTKGFAFVAYPVKYGDSGILTFVVSRFGTIYAKNLGEKTPEIAPKINEYNPDDTWTPVSKN
jgi:hypothetical protein